LNDALLVDTGSQLFEVDGFLDGVSETSDQLDVDVCFDERVANLLDHAIESLSWLVGVLMVAQGHVVCTFSSRVADLVRSLTAALMRRPRSCKTILAR
jgi:hypothetical protein